MVALLLDLPKERIATAKTRGRRGYTYDHASRMTPNLPQPAKQRDKLKSLWGKRLSPTCQHVTFFARTEVNHLYSTAAITNSAGTVVERYGYDGYGKRVTLDANGSAKSGGAVTTVGFTGRTLDVETGLWYFRFRYYNSELGRFIGRDILSYLDGMSLYNAYFVPHNSDPLGLLTRQQILDLMKFLKGCKCAGDNPDYNWDAAIAKAGEIGFGKNWQDQIKEAAKQVQEKAEELKKNLGQAKSLVDRINGMIKAGQTLEQIKAAISNDGYTANGEFGDVSGIKDLSELSNKMKEVSDALGKISNAMTALDLTATLAKGDKMTTSDAASALQAIVSLSSAVGKVPGVGSMLGFMEKALGAIANGLKRIDEKLDDSNYAQMTISCETWAAGPSYNSSGMATEINKSGQKKK